MQAETLKIGQKVVLWQTPQAGIWEITEFYKMGANGALRARLRSLSYPGCADSAYPEELRVHRPGAQMPERVSAVEALQRSYDRSIPADEMAAAVAADALAK